MSPHATIALVALKTITLLLGGLITYFSYSAYRRTGARPLWFLAVGFGIVTAGSLLAGVLHQVQRYSILGGDSLLSGVPHVARWEMLEAALVFESALTALGFAVIVYSLYTE